MKNYYDAMYATHKVSFANEEFRFDGAEKTGGRTEYSYCRLISSNERALMYEMLFKEQGCRDIHSTREYLLVPGHMPVNTYSMNMLNAPIEWVKAQVMAGHEYKTHVIQKYNCGYRGIIVEGFREIQTTGGIVTEFLYRDPHKAEYKQHSFFADSEGNPMKREGDFFISEDGKDMFYVIHKRRGMK